MLNLEELVWVSLPLPDNFLKVRETLTRIGVASHRTKTLYQSCVILHKRGHYAIVHFKQMFMLDGLESNFTEEDRGRLNIIANLLHEWGLVVLDDPEKTKAPLAAMSTIKIIPFKEKSDWKLVKKYTFSAR